MTIVSRQFHLASRPVGMPAAENFALVERPLEPLSDGQLLVRNRWLSVDPYMRGRMSDRRSYIAPFALGGPLDGAAVGVVAESKDERFPPGDQVSHFAGWRDMASSPRAPPPSSTRDFRRRRTSAPSASRGSLPMPV